MPLATRLFAVLALTLASLPAQAERTVIMVMFDGFAPAMVDAANTPNLDRIQAEGTWSHDLVPAFPTISATNHVTYTTGCWPGDHGWVSNYFEDPMKGRFHGSKDADWRTGCEFAWETVEREGMAAAALGFVGHFSSENGATATHAPKEESWEEAPGDIGRAGQVIDLLNSDADDRPRFIAAYFQGPDWTAHWEGTTGEKTIAAAEATDAVIGELLATIDALPEGREAALFIAADHSMVDVAPYYNIGRVMNRQDIDGTYASDGAHAFIYLDDKEDLDHAYEAFSSYDMVTAYKAADYPDYAHLGGSGREGDLMIVLDQPYWIADASEFPWWARWGGMTRLWPDILNIDGIKATHGFPPADDNMHTIFYAWGDGVRADGQVGDIDMIDAVPTALYLLNMKAHPSASGAIRWEVVEQ